MRPDPRRRRLLLAAAALPVAACTQYGPPEVPELAPLSANVARKLWSLSLDGGAATLVPARSGDRVVVADRDGEVRFLAPADGRELTGFSVPAGVVAGVASDGSRHVLGTGDGRLQAFDDAGQRLWNADLGAEPLSVPAVGAGLAVVRLSNASIIAYDLQSGVQRWTHNRRPVALVLQHPSGIVIEPAAVYVGLPAGRLLALAPGNGATLWEAGVSLPSGTNEIERIADILGNPARVGDQVCALAYQGRIACLRADTGRPDWSKDITGSGGADADANRVVAVDTRDEVYAWSRSGVALWTNGQLRGRRLGAPKLVGDRLWVGDGAGVVHVLDASDGRLLGRVEGDGDPILSAGLAMPAGDRPVVVFQSMGGTVFGASA